MLLGQKLETVGEEELRVQGGRETPRPATQELLAGRRSLRPMKGVIVPQLPRARKVPPAAVSGPSPCQERRAAERKTQQWLCQIQAGAGGEREGGRGGMGC